MQVNVTKDGDRVLIVLSGRFDLNTLREFPSAVEPLVTDVGIAAVTIDFPAVEYRDSSALGMLLMLYNMCQMPGSGYNLAPMQVAPVA